MKKLLILAVPIVFLLTFCQKNIGGVTASNIDDSIAKAIKVGDSKTHIDKVLTEIGLAYTYDESLLRYQAIVADGKENCMNHVLYDCSIGIYVYTDENMQYKYHEVEVFYSGL